MIGGEVAAVGVVSYCFEGDNGYAPIGFAAEWCFVFLGALLCSVRSGPTRIALSLPVLASGEISKMTFVPTDGIMFEKPTQAHDKYVVTRVCFNEAVSFIFHYCFYDSIPGW